MSPEEIQGNADHKQFKYAATKKQIKAGEICPWCMRFFTTPTGEPAVHAKCSIGWSDERLAKEGYKRYANS